ncbi:hypothetical protein EJ04DRAFT_101772 [Polyplosphaeria fusca]|uniref:Uncharacterized protein n=1 Tax=Polyplosphaeria fusca TaxID=682080 RepID=A0A9P4QJ87_9PLEO|nr:hypothetical protein EJ04DRAFT_101772 [Polyplosphaeria fusca]
MAGIRVDSRDMNPTCITDDENSDDDSGVVTGQPVRRSPTNPAGANVKAKRSHTSDLGADKPIEADKERLPMNIDLQSDSGASQSPPSAPADAAQVPPPSPAIKRRPTIGSERKRASDESPRKPLRSGSVSSRKPRDQRRSSRAGDDCNDPSCTKCGPNSVRGRRKPELSPLESGLDISYPPFDAQSQRSDPMPYTPRSPTYNRQSAYMQGPAVIQPSQTHARRSSSATRQPRPVSYHGDPGAWNWVPGMAPPYPSPPQEHSHQSHGPPPSVSARYAMQHQPQMHHYVQPQIMGSTPPNYYSQQMQMSPPYEHQSNPSRPPLSSRNSSNYNARRPDSRPGSIYGPLQIMQDQGSAKGPSARYPDAPQSASALGRFPRPGLDSDSSDYESSDEEEQLRIDRERMPPPARPGLRRPNTEYQMDRRMSQSVTLPERPPRERDPRASRGSTSRAPSKNRPALIQGPTKAQSALETARRAEVYVESPRSVRRQSYQGYPQYDSHRSNRNSNRNSKVYDADPVVALRRRGQTDADSRRREDDFVDDMRDANSYMQQTRGSDIPLNDKVHNVAKQRASRVPSGHSEAGSSRSKNSDGKSRISQARTNATGGAGEIRLRVDASAPLQLQFNGDMEGRTLHINPAEDGMADIVIGGGRGNETTYKSERGSVAGSTRRPPPASNPRRDAEEASVRSGRSTQSRREGRDRDREEPRRVLRKNRRGEDYGYNA